MADRTAHVTWSGSLMEGGGTITSVESGAFGPLDVTWAARAEGDSAGLTSPEELIAAAHAACFSMALSHGLAQGRDASGEARRRRDRDLRPRDGDHEDRAGRSRHRARARRGGVPRGRRGREGGLPGLEGARRRARDHARRVARLAPRYPQAMAIDRLVDELDRSYAEAQERMSDPAVYNDHRQAADAGRRLKELETPKRLADEWRQAREDLEVARARSRARGDGRRARERRRAARGRALARARRARSRPTRRTSSSRSGRASVATRPRSGRVTSSACSRATPSGSASRRRRCRRARARAAA